MYRSRTASRSARHRPAYRRAAAVGLAAALTVGALSGSAFGAASRGGGAGGGGGKAATKALLGTKDKATGAPVKVGFVYDGKSVSTDSTYQLKASEAISEYLNEYKGGIGGRPIELVTCESGQNNTAGATDCANKLVREGVILTILAETTATPTVHRILTESKIPVVISSIANRDLLTEPNTTFVLSDPFATQHSLPIGVAKKNKLKKVTAVVIDVPQATELYTGTIGTQTFKDAKVEIELVRLPGGQADMTPQMAEIANGDPTEVHIVGGESFCIAALNGLKAAAFDGPISILNICATEGTRTAVGDYLKGAYIASNTPVGDTKDPGYKQFEAIYDTYGEGIAETDMFNALSTYLVWMGASQALQGLKGEVTPATIAAAIKAMPNEQLPTGGLFYRCNGKAKAGLPAMCTSGTLQTRLDATAKPKLPWTVVSNAKVAD